MNESNITEVKLSNLVGWSVELGVKHQQRIIKLCEELEMDTNLDEWKTGGDLLTDIAWKMCL
jgi:hypothetical protein